MEIYNRWDSIEIGVKMYIEVGIIVVILIIIIFINIRRGGFCLREMVLIAMLVALASASRVALMAIPDAKPTSFIIIATGMMLGGGAGFITGCLVALLSNIFLGIGPWLPWQMVLWGLMGLMSPIVGKRHRLIQALYGFAWGMVFGWTMNLWYYSSGIVHFSWQAYFASCVYSFLFDLTHAVTNAVLLFVFSDGWLKQLMALLRIQLKERGQNATI